MASQDLLLVTSEEGELVLVSATPDTFNEIAGEPGIEGKTWNHPALAGDVLDDIRRIAKNKFDAAKVDLLMNELYPGKDMDVPDPYYGTEPGYHEVYKMIDEVCDVIIKKYTPTSKGTLKRDLDFK